MLSLFTDAPLWVLAFCVFGAVFAWMAAEQFRQQILSDSHKLVREVALRYLQILLGLFGVFVAGIALSVAALMSRVTGSFAGTPPSPAAESTTPAGTASPAAGVPSPTPTITFTPASNFPAPTSTPLPLDPTLAALRSAVVANTNGVGVNVRSIPGLGGTVLMVVPEGERLALLGEQQEVDGYTWVKVVLPDGRTGWAASIFLVEEE